MKTKIRKIGKSAVNGISPSAVTIPNNVPTYLRHATTLLLPHRRTEVHAELLGNLYQTKLDYELRGLDNKAAWTATLREAGPAWLLSLKLARVHTLPHLARILLVGTALGGAGYALQTGVGHNNPNPGSHPGSTLRAPPAPAPQDNQK